MSTPDLNPDKYLRVTNVQAVPREIHFTALVAMVVYTEDGKTHKLAKDETWKLVPSKEKVLFLTNSGSGFLVESDANYLPVYQGSMNSSDSSQFFQSKSKTQEDPAKTTAMAVPIVAPDFDEQLAAARLQALKTFKKPTNQVEYLALTIDTVLTNRWNVIEAFMESSRIAFENVQNKRLEWHEEGPTTTWASELIYGILLEAAASAVLARTLRVAATGLNGSKKRNTYLTLFKAAQKELYEGDIKVTRASRQATIVSKILRKHIDNSPGLNPLGKKIIGAAKKTGADKVGDKLPAFLVEHGKKGLTTSSRESPELISEMMVKLAVHHAEERHAQRERELDLRTVIAASRLDLSGGRKQLENLLSAILDEDEPFIVGFTREAMEAYIKEHSNEIERLIWSIYFELPIVSDAKVKQQREELRKKATEPTISSEDFVKFTSLGAETLADLQKKIGGTEDNINILHYLAKLYQVSSPVADADGDLNKIAFSLGTGIDGKKMLILKKKMLEYRDRIFSEHGVKISSDAYKDLVLDPPRQKTGPILADKEIEETISKKAKSDDGPPEI